MERKLLVFDIVDTPRRYDALCFALSCASSPREAEVVTSHLQVFQGSSAGSSTRLLTETSQVRSLPLELCRVLRHEWVPVHGSRRWREVECPIPNRK